jgi:hypothetical protein
LREQAGVQLPRSRVRTKPARWRSCGAREAMGLIRHVAGPFLAVSPRRYSDFVFVSKPYENSGQQDGSRRSEDTSAEGVVRNKDAAQISDLKRPDIRGRVCFCDYDECREP